MFLNKIFKSKQTKEKDKKIKTEKKAAAVLPAIDKTEKPVEKKVNKQADPSAFKLLIKPLITEKATDLSSLNKYIFVVPVTANKTEVKKKIMNVYGVSPIKINFIKKSGKINRMGRIKGRTKDFKKAIITLAPADKIEIYEGV